MQIAILFYVCVIKVDSENRHKKNITTTKPRSFFPALFPRMMCACVCERDYAVIQTSMYKLYLKITFMLAHWTKTAEESEWD